MAAGDMLICLRLLEEKICKASVFRLLLIASDLLHEPSISKVPKAQI